MKYTSHQPISASGAYQQPTSSATNPQFLPWQPSTWPDLSAATEADFISVMDRIIRETIVDEIENVIEDSISLNGSIAHRGHVIVLAIMCAFDAIAGYGYHGRNRQRFIDFVTAHSPAELSPHAEVIYDMYRCAMVHDWSLAQVQITPLDEPLHINAQRKSVGIRTLFRILKATAEHFVASLSSSPHLLENARTRYENFRARARAY
jgi:hypothetical protein